MADERPDPLVGSLTAHKALVAKSIKIGALYMDGSAAPRSRLSHNLPPLGEKTVPRTGLLNELHQCLTAKNPTGVVTQVALVGPGGVGKSALAVKYGWDRLADFPGGVFLLNCDAPGPATVVAGLAAALGLPPIGTAEQTAAAVKCELEAGEPVLLILDNVADNDTWDAWHQSGVLPVGAVRWLVTSRNTLAGVRLVRVGGVTRAEGLELLAAYRSDAGQQTGKGWAERVVDWFDGVPLGLVVVGAYMALNPKLSWEDYVTALDSRDDLLAVRQTEDAVGRRARGKRIDTVTDDLIATLAADERRGLEYAAFMAEGGVVHPWLVDLLRTDGVELPNRPGYPGNSPEATIANLVGRQILIQPGADSRVLSMPRVLGRRLRDWLVTKPTVRRNLVARVRGRVYEAIAALEARIPRLDGDWEITPVVGALNKLLPTSSDAEFAVAGDYVVGWLVDLARFREAESLARALLDVRERVFGPHHPDTAISLSHLGSVLEFRGDLPAARRLFERALAITEETRGPDHLETAIRLTDLGHSLHRLGDLPGARALFERSLAISERIHGPDHPETATCLSNLAALLLDQGDSISARMYHERARAIRERVLGPDHPDSVELRAVWSTADEAEAQPPGE
jgi:tetratricopeptide (TPR) repeat protein